MIQGELNPVPNNAESGIASTTRCVDSHPIVGSTGPPALQQRGGHQQSFCDACNASCFLMKGWQRKVQARYEGFLLIKRAQRDSSNSRYFAPYQELVPGGRLCTPGQSQSVRLRSADAPPCCGERRHSCGDVLDNPETNSPGERGTIPTPLVVPVRSVSQVTPPNEYVWEKLVNITTEECSSSTLLNNNVPVAALENNTSRKSRKQSSSAVISRIANNGHQRLSRKKSRSQDNLVGRRIKVASESECTNNATNTTSYTSSAKAEERDGGVLLNNKVSTPSIPQLHSSLSRSEGSIHNVTTTRVNRTNSPDGIFSGGSLRAEVGELARLPKKLLDKVSDEVGQIVFYLERWREEYIFLTNTAISIKLSNGELQTLIPYSHIEDVQHVTPSSISAHQHCLLVVTRKTSLLIQASTSYVRDQWLHTIIWKKSAYKYRNLLKTAKRPEVLLKELKNLVDLSLTTPLHDHSVCQVPLEVASSILTNSDNWLSRETSEEIIVTLAPLLENNKPSAEICSFFSRHCSINPRSRLVIDMFTPVVSRILKHNVDFGKYPHVRRFVQNYIQALNSQNDGCRVVHSFVTDMHGSASQCPHLRVLPNLVAVCTSAVCFLLESKKNRDLINTLEDEDTDKHLNCYFSLLELICEYDDWRPGIAILLQPIPFPDYALADEDFIRKILPVIKKIGTDSRCEVHQLVMGPRENKEGWIHVLCPSSVACCDKGDAWTAMLEVLLACCYKRKKFLRMLVKSLGCCMLLALRDNFTAQEILCLMLQWQLVDNHDQCLQIITTLQSTPSGKKQYQALCDRQLHLQELQQKFGPRKLTLPSRSTDGDVLKLLSSGPFGNLEVLSLAFTRVTSACAEQLIQLPTLRYLSLWATQFGDNGLLEICEHLHNLQVLNLCETPVTDKGLSAITALKDLRKLNLNSTKLSSQIFELLKSSLPTLQEVDIRYTDAW